MAAITNLSVRRPVATAMVYLILIALGIVSFRTLPVDLLPQVEFTQLTVMVRYPNVGPEEIEQIITDPIENAVSGLPNLERVTSTSEEGISRVRMEFARGTNVDEAANDLRGALDTLRDELPIEAEAPRIFKLDLDRVEVVTLVATSTRPLQELTLILERDLARRFEQIPGVGAITLRGGIYREIRLNLDRDRLKAAGLTALDVRDAVARENVTLPGGNLKSGFNDLYVRTLGEYQNLEQIRRTVVTNTNGRPLRIEDVANVEDAHQDVSYLAEINGVPSVSIGIQKQSGANTVAVADRIREEVQMINAQRGDLHLSVFADQSEFIRQSMKDVQQSALWGSLLAMLVLYFFLRNGRSTAIIALSIPISVIATFGLLYFGNLTLNQMTFGGLALGVGLIVDNAIVVLESIVRRREERNLDAKEAARIGASEVAGAIVASTLTTCAIFLPVVFTTTTSGALFQALALVVVFALACSLFVALTLVPVLASRYLNVRSREQQDRQRTTRALRKLENWYVRLLDSAMLHRSRVFAVTGVLVVVAVVLWPLIPVELAPPTDADEIDVDIEMAQGTNIAVMRSYLDELEAKVRQVLPPDDIEFVSTEVRGSQAEVELKLVPQTRRAMSSEAIAQRIRDAVSGQIPGAEIEVRAQPGLWILRRIFSSGGGERPIELELRGYDLRQSEQIASQIEQRIEAIPGVTDARVSRREGRPEQNLILDRDRISDLGLTAREVAQTVQANVGGIEAGRLRQAGEEYPIIVRLKPEDRLTGADILNASLRAPSGAVVPLSAVVSPREERGPLAIDRVDSQRVTYITAGLEDGLPLGEAIERIQNELAGLRLPEGFSLYYGGEYREQQEAQRDFFVAITMALLLVYMIMAAQFERFVDPLIVMLSIPVALIGVVAALLLTGTTLNLQSVMGLVMLIGIVVNNAIVLVDTINLLRREYAMPIAEAVSEAGRLRLRPILMTTSTTVLGLLPLALGLGVGGEIQASLARVVIGGLTASTFVTLLLIPTAYVFANETLERLRERYPKLALGVSKQSAEERRLSDVRQ